MKAKIFHIEDEHGDPFSQYVPPDVNRFCFAITALIGPEDAPNGEIFQAIFANRRWIADHVVSDENIATLRGHFLVEQFSQAQIVKTLQTLVSQAKGDNWNDLANWLNRYFLWEFDDYQESVIEKPRGFDLRTFLKTKSF